MKTPLSRCAPSPKGDDSLAAVRPLLAVPGQEQAYFKRCGRQANPMDDTYAKHN